VRIGAGGVSGWRAGRRCGTIAYAEIQGARAVLDVAERKKPTPPHPSLGGRALAEKKRVELNAQQRLFVREYLIDFNGTRAAIAAGYSAKSAPVTASKLLKLPKIQKAIREVQSKIEEKAEVTAAQVIKELCKLGFANMADYMKVGPDGYPYLDFSSLTRDQAAALTEVTVDDYVDGRGEDARQVKRVKFKLADKRAALVDLGRHLGIFKEVHEISGPGGGPIPIQRIERVIVDPEGES